MQLCFERGQQSQPSNSRTGLREAAVLLGFLEPHFLPLVRPTSDCGTALLGYRSGRYAACGWMQHDEPIFLRLETAVVELIIT
jgi:hypothetical protein